MFYAFDYDFAWYDMQTALNNKRSEIVSPSTHMLIYPEADPAAYLYLEYNFIKETADFLFTNGIGKNMFPNNSYAISYDTVMEQYTDWMYDNGYLK